MSREKPSSCKEQRDIAQTREEIWERLVVCNGFPRMARDEHSPSISTQACSQSSPSPTASETSTPNELPLQTLPDDDQPREIDPAVEPFSSTLAADKSGELANRASPERPRVRLCFAEVPVALRANSSAHHIPLEACEKLKEEKMRSSSMVNYDAMKDANSTGMLTQRKVQRGVVVQMPTEDTLNTLMCVQEGIVREIPRSLPPAQSVPIKGNASFVDLAQETCSSENLKHTDLNKIELGADDRPLSGWPCSPASVACLQNETSQAAEPCTSRMPVKGDVVKTLNHMRQCEDASGNEDAWILQPGENAIVVEVDEDGDFRLRNPTGLESWWTFRKYYAYAAQVARQIGNASERDHGREGNGVNVFVESAFVECSRIVPARNIAVDALLRDIAKLHSEVQRSVGTTNAAHAAEKCSYGEECSEDVFVENAFWTASPCHPESPCLPYRKFVPKISHKRENTRGQ
jgi:hypothetical protein